ncbi:hypothetical protein AB4165_04040 [Vibrio cyclitrophicus]
MFWIIHHVELVEQLMRIFNEINRNVERQQLFFIECWASMSNVRSLDSDRVSYNNTLNSVLEMLELFSFGNKHRASEKRRHVVEELQEFLAQDTTLASSQFKGIPKLISNIISEHGEPIENQSALVISLLQELENLLVNHYREVAISELSALLANGADSSEDALAAIHSKANSLLSHLVTLGMPTSECYLLCRNYLKKRDDRTPFSDAFNEFASKVTVAHQPYQVQLLLDNKSLHELLSRTSVSTLGECAFTVSEREENSRSYKVQVEINVEAISFSAARQIAEKRLLHALDLFSYFLGKNEIKIINRVSVTNQQGELKSLPRFDKALVNSLDRWVDDELSIYMEAITHLRRHGSAKSGNKINSAFRFFQNGVNESSLESRFTAFWSALESLTLIDENGSQRHDEHVINSVIPCIALDYPVKQLFALRGCAKSLNWPAIQYNGNEITIQSSNLGSLYSALKDPQVAQAVLDNLNNHPYAQFRFGSFIKLCSSPYDLARKVEDHERKVELHINRLYRVRNAIVHNASTNERLELLIVNLEHYLRSTLNALVYTVYKSPSITSPEEAFIRYQYESKRIFGEMDPSKTLASNTKKRDGKITAIRNGSKVVKDEQLVGWLEMHG